ncbi:MAG: dTMP kinase [Desulfocapsaceae bacterium]|nr:dTMP kinase [Desulfocapsaceae bacterium]
MNKQEKIVLPKGCLIIFEGIDGTGKSTQLRLLAECFAGFGLPVVTTREPTEGKYGQQIRALYQNRHDVTMEEELELFIKDRREHVDRLIKPALEQKKIVLCDRYYLSTIAYQGALGADLGAVERMNDFAPTPELALVFQLEPAIAIKRITEKRGDLLNDFEQLCSLNKVSVIFDNMDFPFIQRIDSNQPADRVHADVIKTVNSTLPYIGKCLC